MSLQLWLPLNGDLHNQGVSSSSICVNSGATIDSSGKIGKCYSFTAGNYMGIDAANVNNFKYANNLSIAMWAYFPSTSSSEQEMIGCQESGGFTALWESQKIKWGVYVNSAYAVCYSSSTLSLNTWHHVVCTYNTRFLKIYVDGVLSNTLDTGGTYNITYNATTPLEIGGNPSAGTFAAGNFTGKLNDIRIYDHCLTAAEVKEIAKGLVLHYPLNNPYNTTIIYDCSGYGYNGTVSGTLQVTDGGARYGKSTYWPSATSAANTIHTPTIYQSGEAITMSVWIKTTTTGGGSYQMPFESNSRAYCEMSITSGGKLRGGLYINGTRYVSNVGSGLLDGNWHLIAITYDGTTIKRYIDGVSVGDTSISGTLNNTAQSYWLGVLGTDTAYYNSQIYQSDVRLYATALSADDIKDLYNAPIKIDKNGTLITNGEVVES